MEPRVEKAYKEAMSHFGRWNIAKFPNYSFGVYKSGLGREDLRKLAENLNGLVLNGDPGIRQGDYHVRVLKPGELKNFPAKRFLNNVYLASLVGKQISNVINPAPVGLFYSGSPLDMIDNLAFKSGIYVSQFVEGERLIGLVNNDRISKEELEVTVNYMGLCLRQLGDIGVFPKDFAPRDLVAHRKRNGIVYLVDNRNVDYIDLNNDFEDNRREQIVEQCSTFIREWRQVPNFEKLRGLFFNKLRGWT